MKEDRFRFLLNHDPNDGTWVIQNPQNSDPTLDATVRHVHVMQMENEDLKEELREAQRTGKRLQKENDALRAQLGLAPLYEKKSPEFTVINTAP
jgi:cell shape-determining protein MreC